MSVLTLRGCLESISNWDKRFISLAEVIANWSKDPSTKVGCVIADEYKHVIGMGYNGFPPGIKDDGRLDDRVQKLAITIHAEENALIHATKDIHRATAYVWPIGPCSNCAAILIARGVHRIVVPWSNHPRFQLSIDLGKQLCKEAGIEYVIIEGMS